MLKTSDFNYHLPSELIAQEPLADRDSSRLLVLERSTGAIHHTAFRDIVQWLNPGDVLTLNNTRVSAFRLRGHKTTGASVEALVMEPVGQNRFRAMVRPGRRLRPGDTMVFARGVTARVVERLPDGIRILDFGDNGVDNTLLEIAETPLPPYIHQPLTVSERYNTVYAGKDGSIAAPTAGLHFTKQLLAQLDARGVKQAQVTLHVGASTFRPVSSENLDDHSLASERIEVDETAASLINNAQGRVIAVGTTSARTLEAAAVGPGQVQPVLGSTDLFIKPGHEFRVIRGLITNFHMPRTTLLVLVAAFAGRENILRAYSEAVRLKYRFLSLGDAMLII